MYVTKKAIHVIIN